MTNLLTLGRGLIGLCFALDGAWWLHTWDVRAAYLEQAGAPSLVIIPIALVYLVCGVLVATGSAVRRATWPLVAVALVIAVLLHTDFDPGGIGEYPASMHPQVSIKTILVQLAIVGALALAYAVPDPRASFDARGIVLGRLLTGGYFVTNALWQALFYETRAEHVVTAGGDPSVIAPAIVIQLVFGSLIVAGRAIRPAAIPLALLTAGSTIMVHGDLTPPAAYVPNQQVHQWFVKSTIIAAVIMLYGLGPAAAPGSGSLRGAKIDAREEGAAEG